MILTSLLIATQGLLPSPTPISIGVQGLLFISVVPPPSPLDLPGGGGGTREERKVTIQVRGNRLVLSVANVDVCAGSRVQIVGSSCFSNAGKTRLSISAKTMVIGSRNHTGVSRTGLSISSTFNVIGCEEENEFEVYLMAKAAMELLCDN